NLFFFFFILARGFDFPHNGLYVEYKFELPSQFTLMENENEIKSTNICYSKEVISVTYFSHIFSASIKNTENPFDAKFFLPRLLFRVCADGYWGKFYVDGYAELSLPTYPGRHKFLVDCWRPINSKDRQSKLFDYFIGQAVDLKSIDCCGINQTINSEKLRMSRIGIETETSGQLEIIIDCALQGYEYLSKEILQQIKYGKMMNRIGIHSNIHWHILRVLLEFEEAKKLKIFII
ncbi:unnamed protein product, partial [Dracunculus medinensis]|uniref:Uncharacterized protein n=1 Tax=Dracunculus medinensis TaxID=318479 RepID=A0A158Q3M8_DRAME